MTKRLSAGVLLLAVFVLAFAMTANAERLQPREWVDQSDPYRELPLFFRSSAGTTWVTVDTTSPCDPDFIADGGDIHDNTDHNINQVFCFEVPDSLWPAGQGAPYNLPNNRRYHFDHYSRNQPPLPKTSKWHVTTVVADTTGGGVTGTYSAWCGCDITESLVQSPGCDDTAFWVNQKGYGDEWEETLIMDVSNLGGGSGGTLSFSVRYDNECVYDYLYLEYLNASDAWVPFLDAGGTAVVFNGVSDNGADVTTNTCDNGAGGASDGNYFDDGTFVGAVPYHGNSVWYPNVTFPVPAQTDLQIRWRGSSDPAWSDFDGRGDTDGIGAIDNVNLVFNNGDDVVDDFELGTFDFAFVNGVPDADIWTFGSSGNTYDGWHITFDPMYKNKGATCTFSSDWMWNGKPDIGNIPENGFEYFLVSPVVPCDGWTGGTVLFSQYQCMPDARNDYTNTHIQYYDSAIGTWAPWQDFDGFVIFAGCDFWNMNSSENLTPFLGANTDSLRVGWEILDQSQEGNIDWGKHQNSQYIVDNVAFGSFDGTGTIFTLRNIDTFADTFSEKDPAHTPFLQNAEQGIWTGIGGTRQFANSDSFNVQIIDQNGLSLNVPTMHYRRDSGPGTAFGSWIAVPMTLALQDPTGTPGEGTYRAIFGNDGGGTHDHSGAGSDGRIWNSGQTVEYYIRVTDDGSNNAYWPGTADPSTLPAPTFAEFSILPFAVSTTGALADSLDSNGRPHVKGSPNAHFVLLVDDYTRNALDFANSTGFNPTGGVGPPGFGSFTGAVLDQPEDMVERALQMLYGGTDGNGDGSYDQHLNEAHWDKYDVVGAGSSVQCEPRGTSNTGAGINAYMTDAIEPYYDALIWLQGTFDGYSYADTTRLELATYLENGGCLFSTGDQVAFHLGTGGNDADSLIGFHQEYLGFSFPNSADETVGDRVLNFTGAGSMAGLKLGIYGECPIRLTPDRLRIAVPGGDGIPTSLGTYTESSDGADMAAGVLAATKCAQPGGGVAAHFAFGIEALLDDVSRARVLGRFLATDCGLPVTVPGGVNNGVDAPQIANGFGFSLAQARPNPFSDATSISFSVPTKTHVSIEVFNILGQKVRTLVNENMEANSYVRNWDGRSDDGAQVSSGIYFYKMVAGDFSATKKAVLLK
jgi:hypothetical protein